MAGSAFPRLVWSNLAAQSAEQIGLAAAPLFAVLALGRRSAPWWVGSTVPRPAWWWRPRAS